MLTNKRPSLQGQGWTPILLVAFLATSNNICVTPDCSQFLPLSCPAHLGYIKWCQHSLFGASRSQPLPCTQSFSTAWLLLWPVMQQPSLLRMCKSPSRPSQRFSSCFLFLIHNISPPFHSLNLPCLKLQVLLTTYEIPSNSAPFYSAPSGQFVPSALTSISRTIISPPSLLCWTS